MAVHFLCRGLPHGSEFVECENNPILPRPALFKKNRPSGGEFYSNHNERKEEKTEYQCNGTESQIEHTFPLILPVLQIFVCQRRNISLLFQVRILGYGLLCMLELFLN